MPTYIKYKKKRILEARDDSLKLLRFLASDVFKFKLVKGILWINLVVHVVTDLMLVYFVLFVSEKTDEKVYYLAMMVTDFYAILAIIILFYKDKLVSEMYTEFPFWSLDNAGPKTASKITKKIKYLTIFTVVTSTTAIIAGCLHVPHLSRDVDWFFVLRLLRDYCPNHEKPLRFLFKLTYIVNGYVDIVHSLQITYYTQSIRYQWIIFRDFLLDLDDHSGYKYEKQLFYNGTYQKEVELRLRFCVLRLEDFVRINEKKVTEISNLIIAFSICGLSFGVGVAIIMSSDIFTLSYYPRYIWTSLAGTLAFSGLIAAGQSLESISDQMVLAISSVKWYNFNKTNTTLYSMLLMHLMRVRKVKFSENYSVNYQLGLAIVRAIYSVMTVFWKKALGS